jgi:putative transposase
VEIDVPRDTGSTFDPQTMKKRQRRLTGVDEIVQSLSAKGLTTGEIAAHFAELFGVKVSKDTEVSEDTVSRTTEKVVGEMTEWQNRPLDRVLPVMLIDAIPLQGP